MSARLRRGMTIAGLAAIVLYGVGAAGQEGDGADRQAAMKKAIDEAAARPTPKLVDGHPDLSGTWSAAAGPRRETNAEAVYETQKAAAGTPENPVFKLSQEQEQAGNLANVAKRKANAAARPEYKPEFQAKWEQFFDRASHEDPSYRCMPLGVPRMGPPREIVHTPKAVYLLYAGLVSTPNLYRIVPTDGRARDKDADPMPNGQSLGRWEGDTLVVETTNFDDSTWLDGDGSFHSDALRVFERFTRKGDTLVWDVTAEDAKVFAKPFKPQPRTLVRAPEGVHAEQDWGCVEMDQELLKGNERH